MKILMIHYSEVTSPGGVHKTVVEMAKNLSKMGHEVTVLQGNPKGLSHEETYEGFHIIRVKSRVADHLYGFSPEIYSYLKKHFKELNPDVIHVHGYHTLFSPEVSYLIKRINPEVPIVFSPHFGVFSRSSFAGKHLWGMYNRSLGKSIIETSDVIVTASKFESDNLMKLFKVDERSVKVIPHGVDFISTDKVKEKNGRINLLYVGYLLELKGIQWIIEALHELVYRRKVKASLSIVGEGPYEAELKKLAETLDVSQFIQWEGFVPSSQSERLREIYRSSDVLLLLSQSENYGIVVSEALASKTPVIVTKRTALNEFLDEPGCFGVNYPPNPEEVADLVLEIHEDGVEVGPLTQKIQMWDEIVKKYEEEYMILVSPNELE
ncbi:Glycogen synthase [anaerobic digester metagenome]